MAAKCEHNGTCHCYRLGYQAGTKVTLRVFAEGDNIEKVLGMPLDDALRDDGLIKVFEKLLSEKSYKEFVVKELFERAKDPAVLSAVQGINTKWNALAEVNNAIANAFYHFPLPGGSKGRYHDTICGENVHWSHVAHFLEGDTLAEREAVSRVTCPPCLERLAE